MANVKLCDLLKGLTVRDFIWPQFAEIFLHTAGMLIDTTEILLTINLNGEDRGTF